MAARHRFGSQTDDYLWNLLVCRRRQADATQLQLPAGSYDVVFSNWLLMYLGDEEVAKLAADALRWVRCCLTGDY